MKFTITFEVPDGTTYAIEGISSVSSAAPEPVFVPPYEDELIPLPPAAIPIPQDPAPFRAMVREARQATPVCPIHHEPWKVVPAGISKKTGRPYDAFQACPVRGCDQRPAA